MKRKNKKRNRKKGEEEEEEEEYKCGKDCITLLFPLLMNPKREEEETKGNR